MYDDPLLNPQGDTSSRTQADVFMTMALLLLISVWGSIKLPSKVEVTPAPVIPSSEEVQWVKVDLSQLPIVSEGQSYPTLEAFLLAVEPDVYVEVDISDSTGPQAHLAGQKIQALGVKNVFFSVGE